MECITGLISKVNPKAFKVKIKTATMGIRSTHFIVNANPQESYDENIISN